MATVSIPWPTSALPGRRPGDGQGDLLNCYAVKIGDLIEIRRTPGLVKRAVMPDAVARIPRGTHALPDRMYHAWDNEVRVTIGGTDTPVIGALPGIDRVTMAHNMRDMPWVDVVLVDSLGAYLINVEDSTISAYPDPDGNLARHGQPNSCEYFAGYFVFTAANGYFTVSGLQNVEIPAKSFAKAEYAADRLLRAKAMQAVLLLMSTNSIEAWVDVATYPFPFQRQTSMDIGILGRWAVAGGSNEWERGILFAASDFTVRQMDGIVPRIVSTDDVSMDLYDYRTKIDTIVAQVYIFEQQAVFSLTTPTWTWEYNLTSGSWHRRDSYGLDYWRATSALQYRQRWMAQDLVEAKVFEIRAEVFDEDKERLRFRCDSGPMKAFPASVRIPSIDIDCIMALGQTSVPSPYQTDPVCMISWSHDGGANWSRPVSRSMGKTGRYGQRLTVHNLGRSTHHGTRIRVEIVDPVPATIIGGVTTSMKPSRPRQVDK